jgi:2-iminobutanoate/2-iminopropanoate deaminase
MRVPVTGDRVPKPIAPFSPAIRDGELVYVSGHVGMDPKTSKLVSGDVAAQTRQAIDNIDVVLQAAGKSLDSVLKVNVYLADMNDFAAMNAEYGKRFKEPYPARTTIGVAALPLGAKVELEAIAR